MICALLFVCLVQSNQFQLHSLTQRCLDGSPAAYYSFTGNRTDALIVFFEQGEQLLSESISDSLDQAFLLANSSKGSSKLYPTTVELNNSGILSSNNISNAYFHNWTKILLKSCDGSGFIGSRAHSISFRGEDLHFRGSNIVLQLWQELDRRFSIFSDPKLNLIVGGAGNGGTAALLHGDLIAKKVTGKLRLFSDSNMYILSGDYQSQLYKQQIQTFSLFLLKQQNYSPLPTTCIANQNNPFLCLLPQYYLSQLTTPSFLIVSQYDPKALVTFLGVNCVAGFSLKYCKPLEIDAIDFYRLVVNSLVGRMARQEGWAAWSIGCVEYDFVVADLFDSKSYTVPMHSNWTVSKGLQDWIEDKLQDSFMSDLLPWPDNQPCSNS